MKRQSKAKKPKLREGEYPSKVVATNGAGERVVQEVVASVPPSDRPVAPIRQAALSEYLLPMFDGLNIRGKTGVEALLLLARMGAHRYDALKRFCVAWEDLHQPNLFAEIYPELEFQEPTLEQVCDAGKVDPEELVGDIWREAYHYGSERARLQLAFHLPEVEQAAFDSALLIGKEGHADRKMLLEAGKIVESGPSQVINVNNSNVVGQLNGLPAWEESDKLVSGTLFNRGQLAERSVVEGETVEVEVVVEPLKVKETL